MISSTMEDSFWSTYVDERGETLLKRFMIKYV